MYPKHGLSSKKNDNGMLGLHGKKGIIASIDGGNGATALDEFGAVAIGLLNMRICPSPWEGYIHRRWW